ncbi:MAG: hypothetical protein HY738_14935 [Bacteroidia bacterium]|nr:hypothetical protein [Bacteroidia bacterium]
MNIGNGVQTDLSNRLYLESLTELDATGNSLPPYTFTYSDRTSLPDRLSYSQDHWGYANDKYNLDFVPQSDDWEIYFGSLGGNREPDNSTPLKGLLTRIDYPTGGFESIIYEANSVNENYTIHYYTTEYINDPGSDWHYPTSTLFNFVVYGTKVTVKYGLSIIDNDNFDDLHEHGEILIKDDGLNILLPTTSFDEQPTENTTTVDIGTGMLTLWLTTYGEHIQAWCEVTYEYQSPGSGNHNVPVGGARVNKRIITAGDGQPAQVFRYFYNTFDNRNKPAAVIDQMPLYYSQSMIQVNDAPIMGTIDCNYINKHSSSQFLANAMGKNFINYPNVTVSFGDNFENGGIEYHYDYSPPACSEIIWGEDIPSSSKDNIFEWRNGRVLSEKQFKVTQDPATNELVPVKVKETYYHYTESNYNFDTVNGLTMRKTYDPIFVQSVHEECSGNNDDYKIWSCTKNHQHHWYLTPWSKNWRCIGGNWNVVYYYPCYNHLAGDIIYHPAAMDNYDIAAYTLCTRWVYNDSTTVLQYDINGTNPVEIIEISKFENPEYPLVTKKESFESTGANYKRKYKYIFDYQNSISLVNTLLNIHNWALVEEQSWVDNKLY